MNNVCGYGRTRTHLILLSALAVLCIAIVFMCVFSNLNALATDNIAYADEPKESTRANYVTTTFSNNNLIPSGVFTNQPFSYVSSITENSWWISGADFNTIETTSNGLHVTKNTSGASYLMYCLDSSVVDDTVTVAIGVYSGSNSAYRICCYNYESVNSYTAPSSTMGTTSRTYYYTFSKNSSVSGVSAFGFYSGSTGVSITFSFFKVENGNYYTGQPANNYSPNGYDVGYADGQQNVSIPDFTNSTGLVGDNILQYSYFDDSTFNQDVSSSSFTDIWVSVDNTQSIKLAYGSITDNVISCDGLESRAYTDLRFSVPLMTRPYVIACYVTDIVGNWGLLVNGLGSSADIVLQEGLNVLYIPELSREETRASTTDIDIYVSQASGRSITLHWIKLESGTAFTGYVAPDNANSYESGYEQGLIDGYYNGITDLNSMREVLVNVDLQTKGPYYVVNKTDTPYGVNNDYYDITWSISDSVSGVTYGSYIPIIFNLGYTVPIGLDLIWKFDGVLLNPHSSAVDPNGSSTIYYGFYNSTSFVTYGPEYAPYQDIITWPNGEVNQLVFHATYSGCFLILWFYTDSTNPYYEFGIRTPVVDGSYNSIPYTFEFNPYTVTDSSENLDNARQQGYNQGFTRGYNQGKYENANSSGYTFSALLGSVFDAPITALLGSKQYDEITGNYIGREGGLLNFEILGVNLGGFVIGLLSLAIILFILRVFMRGL